MLATLTRNRRGNKTTKLTTVCPTCVKGLSEEIRKICSLYGMRRVFRSNARLSKYGLPLNLRTEYITETTADVVDFKKVKHASQ